MKDPIPENITGEKRVVHTVSHEVNWGYLAVGTAGLLLVYVLLDPFGRNSDHDNNDLCVPEPRSPSHAFAVASRVFGENPA